MAAWAVGDLAAWAALPAYLLFAWLTVGLIWIDPDAPAAHRPRRTHRLGHRRPARGRDPRRVTGAGREQPSGFLVTGAVYLLLSVLPGGGVTGGGDVRLAPLNGALLGWLGAGQLRHRPGGGLPHRRRRRAVLLLSGRAGLKSPIAYGPAMCLGAWVGIASTSRILTWLSGG